MLGSRSEAEDAVQEAWLRLDRSDPEQIDNLGGWLTTVVARLCLDRLRARRSRPETPIAEHEAHDVADVAGVDPAQQALMAESVGAALLVVLDSLGPAERVAFVLHDVFAVPFDEIAEIVGRSPDATRQLASRARRRVQGTTTADVDPLRQRTLVDAFLRAARGGDFEGLLQLLDPDVVLQPDEAAVRMGSLRETRGAEAVAGALSGGAQTAALAIVDGLAGLVWAPAGRTRGVIEFTVAGDRIVAIHVTGDAERIGELDIVVLDA
jgi:RNA polymerase sigma-70 factor (ECF subfamily)